MSIPIDGRLRFADNITLKTHKKTAVNRLPCAYIFSLAKSASNRRLISSPHAHLISIPCGGVFRLNKKGQKPLERREGRPFFFLGAFTRVRGSRFFSLQRLFFAYYTSEKRALKTCARVRELPDSATIDRYNGARL